MASSFREVEDVFPRTILEAAPPEMLDMGAGSYLSQLKSDHPDVFLEALAFANLHELWGISRSQFDMSTEGVRQLKALTDHPACDFSLALDVLNYAEVSYFAEQDPASLEDAFQVQAYQLVRDVIDRMNQGAFPFSSEDRKTSRYGLEHYQNSVPKEGGWRLSDELFRAAQEHADLMQRMKADESEDKMSFDEALELVRKSRG